MTTQELDMVAVQQFAGQVLGWLNGAAVTQALSIGHHTGLLDTMGRMPAATSEQIAATAGLNERYVCEWLGTLVTGGVVDYDPSGRTYRLPPERAAVLTRAGGPRNLSGLAALLPQLAQVEDGILDAFRNGGGVPYADFPKFQKLMAELSGRTVDAALLDVTLPLVPGLRERLAAGIDVADIGCGSGHAINVMARAYPNSRFTGFDFSKEGIARGTAEAAVLELGNARFVEQDAATLNVENAFDFITAFDAIHDQAAPRTVLANIARALRPGGTLLMVDIQASSNLEENIGRPLAPAFYTISTMHCMTVSLALGGEGLGSMWGEQTARDLLTEAGFTLQQVAQVPGDIVNYYYICTKA